jgi:hypothetical protein
LEVADEEEADEAAEGINDEVDLESEAALPVPREER